MGKKVVRRTAISLRWQEIIATVRHAPQIPCCWYRLPLLRAPVSNSQIHGQIAVDAVAYLHSVSSIFLALFQRFGNHQAMFQWAGV